MTLWLSLLSTIGRMRRRNELKGQRLLLATGLEEILPQRNYDNMLLRMITITYLLLHRRLPSPPKKVVVVAAIHVVMLIFLSSGGP